MKMVFIFLVKSYISLYIIDGDNMFICKMCKRGFIVKRRLFDLLSDYKYLVCDKCISEHPIKISITELPLNNSHTLKILTLLDEEDISYELAYINEYSQVVSRYLSLYPILYDKCFVTSKLLTQMEELSMLLGQDILIIAFKAYF